MGKTYHTNLRSQDAALFVALFPDQTSGMDRDITVDYLNGLLISAGGKDLWMVRDPVTKKWSVLSKRPEGWAGKYEYFPLRLNYEGTISANIHPLNVGEYVLVKTKEDVDLLEGLMADAVDSANWNRDNFIQVMRKAVETTPHFVCHYGDRYCHSTAGSTYYANAGKTIRPLLKFQSLVGLPPELKARAKQSEEAMVLAYNSLPLNNKPLKYELMFPPAEEPKISPTATTLTVNGTTTYVVKDWQSLFAGCNDLARVPADLKTVDLKPVETEKEKNAVTLMHDGLPVWLPPGRFFTRVHKDDFELFCYVFRGVTWGDDSVVTADSLKQYANSNSTDFLWLYFDSDSRIGYHAKKEPYVYAGNPHEFFPFMCNQDGSKNQNVEFYSTSSNRMYFKISPQDRGIVNRYIPAIAEMPRDASYFRAESATSCGHCMEEGAYERLGRKRRRFAEIRVKPEAKPAPEPEIVAAMTPPSPAERMPYSSKVIIRFESASSLVVEKAKGLWWVSGDPFNLESLRVQFRNRGYPHLCVCRDSAGRFFIATLDNHETGMAKALQLCELVNGELVVSVKKTEPVVLSLAERLPSGSKAIICLEKASEFLPETVTGLKWVSDQVMNLKSLEQAFKNRNCKRMYICRDSNGKFYTSAEEGDTSVARESLQLYEIVGSEWVLPIPKAAPVLSLAESMPLKSKVLLSVEAIEQFLPTGVTGLVWVDHTSFDIVSLLRLIRRNCPGGKVCVCRSNSGKFSYTQPGNANEGEAEYLTNYIVVDGKWVKSVPVETPSTKEAAAVSMPRRSKVLVLPGTHEVYAPVEDEDLRWVDSSDFTAKSLAAVIRQDNSGNAMFLARDSGGQFFWNEDSDHANLRMYELLKYEGGKWLSAEPILPWAKTMPEYSRYLLQQSDVPMFCPVSDVGLMWINSSMAFISASLKSAFLASDGKPIWVCRDNAGEFYYALKESDGCKELPVATFSDGKWTTINSVVQTPPIQTEGSQFSSLKDMPNKSAVRFFTRNEAAAAVSVNETGLRWLGGQVITQAAILARCGELPITIFRNSDGSFTWSAICWHSYEGLKYRLQTDGIRRATTKHYLIDEMKERTYVLVRRKDVEAFVGEDDAEYRFCGGQRNVNAEAIISQMDSLGVDELWLFRKNVGFLLFVKESELFQDKSRYAIKDGKYVDWKAPVPPVPAIPVDAQVKWVDEVASATKAVNFPSSIQTKVSGDSDMALSREDQLFIAQAIAEATKAKAAEQAGPSKVGSALSTAGSSVLNAAAYMTVQPLKEMANPVWQVVRYGFAITTLLAAVWGAVYTGAVVYQDGLPIRFGRDAEVAKPEAPAVAPVPQASETALSEASPSDSQD